MTQSEVRALLGVEEGGFRELRWDGTHGTIHARFNDNGEVTDKRFVARTPWKQFQYIIKSELAKSRIQSRIRALWPGS
jgi:hypothetical protein